jgi:hypothetical protein
LSSNLFLFEKKIISDFFALPQNRIPRQEGMTTPIGLGVRVVRGPDWKWGDQDGGDGYTGTVVEICGHVEI